MLDFHALALSGRPNQYLALPPGYVSQARPHRISPIFRAAPDTLLAALKAVATDEPRTVLLNEDRAARQIHLVQRSRIFRFPDFVTVEAVPIGDGSALAIFSRAKYGVRDFGVNRARVERWLTALERRVPSA